MDYCRTREINVKANSKIRKRRSHNRKLCSKTSDISLNDAIACILNQKSKRCNRIKSKIRTSNIKKSKLQKILDCELEKKDECEKIPNCNWDSIEMRCNRSYKPGFEKRIGALEKHLPRFRRGELKHIVNSKKGSEPKFNEFECEYYNNDEKGCNKRPNCEYVQPRRGKSGYCSKKRMSVRLLNK